MDASLPDLPSADARWDEVCALYADALALPEAARAAFVAALARRDATLADEVQSLLTCTPQAETFFDASPGVSEWLAMLATDAGGPETAGTAGAYALVREIGRGGMGTVYLAERADGTFEKRVALKVIRRGLDTDDVLERFARERHVLARLDHPGIARLLDGGTTDDGRPYFVMEYVEGEPLVDYCDARGLDVEARLRVMIAVSEAVQYAHQNLVVHRDLKPSNILVTASGQPKLLDFGIARMLTPDADDATRTEARRLTPAYAAPEQERGDAVTTAADVYALGVLLYELLTGHRPVDVSRDGDLPIRPSSAAALTTRRESSGGETGSFSPADTAAARGTTPARLARRLAGDLDTICLRALHPEPARRYASATAFADDLRRHLDGLPVVARGDAALYRAARFLRRHYWGSAVTAGAVLLLAGVAVFALVQQRATARARDRAEQVSALLTGLFREANPRLADGPDVTVRDVLDRGAASIAADSALAPDVQAELLALIGSVYGDLGAHAEALGALREALARYDSVASPVLYGTTLTRLGAVYHTNGQVDSAAAALHRAARVLAPTADDDAKGELLNELGEVYIQQGDYPRADSALRASLSHVLRASGPASGDYGTALLDLGMLYNKWGRYDSAEVYQRRGLDVTRALLGPDHLDVATAENTLGSTLYRLGRLGEAETLHRHALDVRARLLPPDHPQVATAWGNLANVLREQERYDEAAAAMKKAYEIDLRARGPEAPNTVISHYNLALVRQAQGAHREAEKLLRESVRLHEQVWPGRHPYTAFPLTALGQVLLDDGRASEAVAPLREALRIREAKLDAGDWLTAQTRAVLGAALVQTGRDREGEKLLVEGYEGIARTRGPGDRHARKALDALIAFLDVRGRSADADRYRALLQKK